MSSIHSGGRGHSGPAGTAGSSARAPFVFGAIFSAVGIGIVVYGLWNLQRAGRSADWPAVRGVITSSTIRRLPSGGKGRSRSSNYKARIEYEYTVDGVALSGDRVSFEDASRNSGGQARAIAGRYPVGTEVAVYYDPDDPATAVLQPGTYRSNRVLPWAGGIFAVIGIALLIGGVVSKVRGRGSDSQDASASRAGRTPVGAGDNPYGERS